MIKFSLNWSGVAISDVNNKFYEYGWKMLDGYYGYIAGIYTDKVSIQKEKVFTVNLGGDVRIAIGSNEKPDSWGLDGDEQVKRYHGLSLNG